MRAYNVLLRLGLHAKAVAGSARDRAEFGSMLEFNDRRALTKTVRREHVRSFEL